MCRLLHMHSKCRLLPVAHCMQGAPAMLLHAIVCNCGMQSSSLAVPVHLHTDSSRPGGMQYRRQRPHAAQQLLLSVGDPCP